MIGCTSAWLSGALVGSGAMLMLALAVFLLAVLHDSRAAGRRRASRPRSSTGVVVRAGR